MSTPIIPQPVIVLSDPAKPPTNYLAGIREDNILDGLIGNSSGFTGGGWLNPVTGLGTFGRDKVLQGRYEEPFRIDDPQISALYNGNDLAKRIIVTKPREMMRRGWCLVIPADDPDEEDVPYTMSEVEQPGGGESGPAAPGAPLVDPMGVALANASAANTAPTIAPAAAKSGEDDPMGEHLAKGAKPPLAVDPSVVTGQDPANSIPEPSAVAMRKQAAKEKITAKSNPKTREPLAEDQAAGAALAVQIESYASRLGLKPRVYESMIFGRAYGGGILVVGADDGRDMATPLAEDEIKAIRYLTWIDRRFVFASQWYSEIGPKYGEVMVWQLVNPFGGQSNTFIHETRVIRFDGEPVDFLMRRRLLGWTLSVLQAPYDTLRQFDMSFQSISNLMADMSQAVMKINGLAQLISNDQKTLNTRMQMVDMSRSSGRMLYIDAENEEFNRQPTPLTGVADVIEMQMLRVAAAAEMPVAILFGREPSGLNATGDADFRRFYDVIEGAQKTELEPKLRRLYTLICAAKDGPTGGRVPAKGVEFVWHKLYAPSEKEQAEIRWLMAQADDKYIQNQTVLPEEVAMSRFRNGELHLDTEIVMELREEKLDDAELAPSGAEQFQAEQDNKQAELAIKATAAAGKPQPGKPRTDSADVTAWSECRYDALNEDVYDMMSDDFPDEAINWVCAAQWRGPQKIACDKVDDSNKADWKASQPSDADRVEKFADILRNGGKLKPIVVVQRPRGKAMIVDGHHRYLAHEKAGKANVLAYVAKVQSAEGPWDETHDMQRGATSG